MSAYVSEFCQKLSGDTRTNECVRVLRLIKSGIDAYVATAEP